SYTTCEGTVTYTYSYADCSGLPFSWTYTYTIDHTTAPAEVGTPVAISSTVQCASSATAPATLPVVKDVCGTTLTGTLISTVNTPNPVICEGTRAYTYRFTDCSGLTIDWTYTYTIDHTTAPAEVGGPVPVSGTVECASAATEPPASLPVIKDVCGTTLTGTLLSTVNNPNPVICEGTRAYTYRYTDCSGLTYDWTYTYTIDHTTAPSQVGGPVSTASTVQCASSATAPSILPVVKDVCGTTLTGTLFSTVNTPNPVICEGTIAYTYRFTDCSGLTFDWTYTYTIDHTTAPAEVGGPVSVTSTLQCASSATAPTTLPVVKDVCGVTLSPTGAPTVGGTYSTCEGTITYTYNYVDCSGLTYAWTYTYTIDHTTAPVEVGGPVSVSSTVQCASSATAPAALPVVKDVCGVTLSPTGSPVVGGSYTTCEGTVTYTYSYADCSGLPFSWTYTYTIDHTTAPAEVGTPVAISSTVQCASSATVPATLPVIKDVCGVTLSPTGAPTIGGTYTTCEGTKTYTYSYADCSGLPFTWT
ncbi:MAG: hypothetical protein WBP41_08395, partial [Saprospiraceae bacterium]